MTNLIETITTDYGMKLEIYRERRKWVAQIHRFRIVGDGLEETLAAMIAELETPTDGFPPCKKFKMKCANSAGNHKTVGWSKKLQKAL
jgi:hypothetical protein